MIEFDNFQEYEKRFEGDKGPGYDAGYNVSWFMVCYNRLLFNLLCLNQDGYAEGAASGCGGACVVKESVSVGKFCKLIC